MISKTNIIFEESKQGRIGFRLPASTVKEQKLSKYIDKKLLRTRELKLPELGESQVVRHYSNLSVKNHHVDKNFYPLGSCTMKYNPKINDCIAMDNSFSGIHPSDNIDEIQGILKIYYNLGKMLCEITEMDGITLQPAAGSQGELVGLLLMKKYHSERKNNSKKYVIIPDTAHGTNPASVIMSGYEVKKVRSGLDGRVDFNHLLELVDDETAGMMLTQPNTLGLFENQIEKISNLIHSKDALMYMDGANLNALVGMASPGKMGFDITHINTHKTFSTPHGGGGPGAGPVAVNNKLASYLPNPIIDFKNDKYCFVNLEKSIGRLHSFYGNFGVLIRAYVYILSHGKEFLKDISTNAVLNANYLKTLLMKKYDVPFSQGTLHEFVISANKQKQKGIKALDIAKNLLDDGFHAPTIYFPTNVPESIMIEPTETETKETLDKFVSAMNDIDNLIGVNIEKLKNAPYNTPVRKLNETKANRELDLNWNIKK